MKSMNSVEMKSIFGGIITPDVNEAIAIPVAEAIAEKAEINKSKAA